MIQRRRCAFADAMDERLAKLFFSSITHQLMRMMLRRVLWDACSVPPDGELWAKTGAAPCVRFQTINYNVWLISSSRAHIVLPHMHTHVCVYREFNVFSWVKEFTEFSSFQSSLEINESFLFLLLVHFSMVSRKSLWESYLELREMHTKGFFPMTWKTNESFSLISWRQLSIIKGKHFSDTQYFQKAGHKSHLLLSPIPMFLY